MIIFPKYDLWYVWFNLFPLPCIANDERPLQKYFVFFCLHRSIIGNQNPKYAKPNFKKFHQIKMSPKNKRKSTRKFAKQISRKFVSIIANIDYQNNNVIKIRNLTLIIEMIQCKMFNSRFDPQFHIWGMCLRSLLYFYTNLVNND